MNRRWALAAALVVIVSFAGGAALRVSAAHDGVNPGQAFTPPLPLGVSVPSGFREYALHGDIRAPGVIGRVLTDFRVPPDWRIGDMRLPESMLLRWNNARDKYVAVKNHNYGPPSNVVALSFTKVYGPFCIGPCPPPSVRLHLPLDPNQPWDEARTASGRLSYRSGLFRFRRFLYAVTYWIGPDATKNDRAALLRALRSIRPA
jgi:hypothetical protein